MSVRAVVGDPITSTCSVELDRFITKKVTCRRLQRRRLHQICDPITGQVMMQLRINLKHVQLVPHAAVSIVDHN